MTQLRKYMTVGQCRASEAFMSKPLLINSRKIFDKKLHIFKLKKCKNFELSMTYYAKSHSQRNHLVEALEAIKLGSFYKCWLSSDVTSNN